MHRYKKKIGVGILLLAILVLCGFIGQLNVRKSLFKVSSDFAAFAVDDDGDGALIIKDGNISESTFKLDNSFVTLEFSYELYGIQPVNANLHIEVRSLDFPENVLEWEFVPGTMLPQGAMKIDLKSFKGQTVQMSIACKGEFEESGGVLLKDIYLSKLYTGD